jgi:preprotein translocase subunit SecA
MLKKIATKLFGTQSSRYIKTLRPIIVRTNELEAGMRELDEAALRGATVRFRERLDAGEPLDDMLPEVFATAREASRRVLNMRHYDVQLVGGLILHQGRIAEMKTGEGKTLVATLPMYANALLGKGAHLVTVNDYLASRDAAWMGRLYNYLGMSVGVIYNQMPEQERIRAYRCDITYGQNNEFGFDYLRDNMKFSTTAFAQRPLHYAIVDEVDSILVDEARTPLIISGPAEQSTDKYYTINGLIPRLQAEDDFTVDEKTKSATLTDDGVSKVEKMLGVPNLYDPAAIEILHHVNQGLRAHAIYRRDVDYMVKDGEVIIVDEFTGRLMPGRRWSDGLHQAIEAKEGVTIERENQTLATITFQNYFRMYEKLSGMTGTAETEAEEFGKIYGLQVVVVPTNKPMVRKDLADVVYRTEREKFQAVIDEIRDCQERGQPTLVGTISIEKSERLADLLKREGVRHHVLNAKQHQREAEIVAQAGRKGAVTISTNMAGRGTDILLGGNPEFLARGECSQGEEDPRWEEVLDRCRAACASEREEVLEAGGLHIIGTERHESRRIDNQLRGRAGRQGDPGSSRFFLSLEDDLLRIFGAERIQGLMQRLGMEDGVPIESRMVSRAVENAQRKVEGHNFDIRKHLLEYDDVMNKQREVIYSRRREFLTGEDLKGEVLVMAEDEIAGIVANFTDPDARKQRWDAKAIEDAVYAQFRFTVNLDEEALDGMKPDALVERIAERAREVYEIREADFTAEITRQLERMLLLQAIDHHWKDHLLAMDHLREGIGLRGYGQRNPLQEYQREGFDMFEEMLGRFQQDVVEKMFTVQIQRPDDVERMEAEQRRAEAEVERATQNAAAAASDDHKSVRQEQVTREAPKVGRNDACPCGSGRKYKKCHGKME